MIFFLILGIALGVVAVVFVLQNTDIVTVTFMAWQIQGSMALILFLAITSGVVIMLLLLLPGFISEAFSVASLRKKNKVLEDELGATKQALAEATAPPPAPQATVIGV